MPFPTCSRAARRLAFVALGLTACVGRVGGDRRPDEPASPVDRSPGLPASPVTPARPDAPPALPGAAPVAIDDPRTPGACDQAHLLRPRVVRLASADLRAHVRAALPGVNGALIDGINLQAQHVAPVSERTIGNADFQLYYQTALAVAESYAATSAESQRCRSGTPTECLDAVLKPVVTRLYRRPPTGDEWTGIATTFQRIAAGQDTTRAASAVVAAALLAPQTMFHVEDSIVGANGVRRLTRFAALDLARFAFTGRAAEPAESKALDGARDGDLALALAQAAQSWVATPEFQGRGADFAERHFGVEHLPELSRADPLFTPAMARALAGEFREFMTETLLARGGTFGALFTKRPSRVFPGLERIYEGTGGARRKGVLGLASLLAAEAAPTGSDPVKRGMMVRVKLLCESVPPPVADATFDKVPTKPEMQTRERFEALAALEGCSVCHQFINPPGYLFEEFDQIGRHRLSEKGRPIDARGTLPPPPGASPYPGVGEWDGIVPLADWISTAKEARICFAARFASYVLAEEIPQGHRNCHVPTVAARFVQSGRIDELAADLLASDLFLARRREAP